MALGQFQVPTSASAQMTERRYWKLRGALAATSESIDFANLQRSALKRGGACTKVEAEANRIRQHAAEPSDLDDHARDLCRARSLGNSLYNVLRDGEFVHGGSRLDRRRYWSK
jgi:hypothetical protein